MGIFAKFREILYIDDTPHRLALSFSLGVFLAICPLIGLHTLIAVALCFVYRFNKFVLFLGVYMTNPWTMIPIYTFCTWIGTLLLRCEFNVMEIDWTDVSFKTLHIDLEPILMPFVVGSTVVSTVAGVTSYFVVRAAVIRAHALRDDAGRVAADSPGGGK